MVSFKDKLIKKKQAMAEFSPNMTEGRLVWADKRQE